MDAIDIEPEPDTRRSEPASIILDRRDRSERCRARPRPPHLTRPRPTRAQFGGGKGRSGWVVRRKVDRFGPYHPGFGAGGVSGAWAARAPPAVPACSIRRW